MLKYTLLPIAEDIRAIFIKPEDTMKYRLLDSNKDKLNWEPTGKDNSQLVAVVTGKIHIFRKESLHLYHNDIMQHAGRSLHYGLRPHVERIEPQMQLEAIV